MEIKNNQLLRATGIISCLTGILLIMFGNVKTPENRRIINDFIQNILILNLLLLIFQPNNKQVKVALIIGIFSLIFDFVIETIAVYLGWWYPLGGIQYPPILVVPLEMVLSFFIIGTSMGVILTFPEKIREMDFKPLNWLKLFVRNPKYDWFWIIILIIVNTIISSYGDLTAGPETLVLGSNWHDIILYVLNPWLIWGFICFLLFYYLNKGKKESTSSDQQPLGVLHP